MTTFALVHGAWHDRACWTPLAQALSTRGHRIVRCDLPGDEVGVSFEEYAMVVLTALDGIEDPVLVGHSLGACTAALVAAARPVSRTVYLCPHMGSFARRDDDEPPAWMPDFRSTGKDDFGRSYWSREDALRVMYPRVERSLAERMAARLRPQAPAPRRTEPLAAPPSASTLVMALEDECFRIEWSRWAARTLLGVEPIELPGGHFPMLERPDELAELLERVSA